MTRITADNLLKADNSINFVYDSTNYSSSGFFNQ